MPETANHLADLSVRAVLGDVERGAFTSREYLEALLDRHDVTEPTIRAFTWLVGIGTILAGIVGVQAVTVFMCRSEHESAFRTPGARNPLLLVGVAVQLLVVAGILYSAVGNRLFATRPLPMWAWLDIVPFAVVLLLGEEVRKWAVRRMAAPPRAR